MAIDTIIPYFYDTVLKKASLSNWQKPPFYLFILKFEM